MTFVGVDARCPGKTALLRLDDYTQLAPNDLRRTLNNGCSRLQISDGQLVVGAADPGELHVVRGLGLDPRAATASADSGEGRPELAGGVARSYDAAVLAAVRESGLKVHVTTWNMHAQPSPCPAVLREALFTLSKVRSCKHT